MPPVSFEPENPQSQVEHSTIEPLCFFIRSYIMEIEAYIYVNGNFFLKFPTHFSFHFKNKMLIFRVRIHKILAMIANREDPAETASSEAV